MTLNNYLWNKYLEKTAAKTLPGDSKVALFKGSLNQGSLYDQPKQCTFFQENPSNLPYICILWFPHKTGPIEWPLAPVEIINTLPKTNVAPKNGGFQ